MATRRSFLQMDLDNFQGEWIGILRTSI